MNRRAFLTGRPAEPRKARPPGAHHESLFLSQCTRCGDCLSACGEGIIVNDARGYPALDFTRGGCAFCGDCAAACKPGALAADAGLPWRAAVAPSCISMNGVQCRSCQDHCAAGAIRFRLRLGGSADPVIDAQTCTGCGSCIAPCPVGAIAMNEITHERMMA